MKVKALDVSERTLRELLRSLNGVGKVNARLARRLADVKFVYGIEVVGPAKAGHRGMKRVRLLYE